MSDFNESAGTFLRVNVEDGSWYAIAAHEASIVRKAVVDFREKGIDSLLEIEDRYGVSVGIVASIIIGFVVSTPEGRLAASIEELRQEEWEADVRKLHAAKEWEA